MLLFAVVNTAVAIVMDTDKENMLLYCTELHNMMSMMSEPYLPYLKC